MQQRSSVEQKPLAEVLVEGELSPFEHEALVSLLKKHFRLDQPRYSDPSDESVGTHLSIVFHHSYDRSFYNDIIREGWRDLKGLFKQISYRRGRLGAGFTLSFIDQKIRLDFVLGVLSDEVLVSAMDQLAHLTGIVGQMLEPDRVQEALGQIEVSFDRKADRWQGFRGFGLKDQKEYMFDETLFRWKPR
jgi:hypothetical protein